MADPTHRFRHAVRVGYADTDQGGIAHHSVYVRWMEEARVALLRHLGIDFKAMETEMGISVVVSELHMQYRLPAEFEDVLLFETWVEKLGHASMVLGYRVTKEGDEAERMTAQIKLVCIDLAQKRPRAFPDSFSAPLRTAMPG